MIRPFALSRSSEEARACAPAGVGSRMSKAEKKSGSQSPPKPEARAAISQTKRILRVLIVDGSPTREYLAVSARLYCSMLFERVERGGRYEGNHQASHCL